MIVSGLHSRAEWPTALHLLHSRKGHEPDHRQSGVWQKAGPVSGEGRKPALRHGPKIV